MSNLAVFNVPALGSAFFSGKIQNKGKDVGGFTGSYNGLTREYKITGVYNVNFKDTLKSVQKITDHFSKLASDNGGVLTGINFNKEDNASKLELVISELSAEGASGATADVCVFGW
jgi:hypothetical protein